MKKPVVPCAPRSRRLAILVLLGGSLVRAGASDWPHWLGPTRDSVWNETGLIETIPETGLKVKWEHPVGLGYSGPAVADGRVYVMDYQRTSGEISNNAGWRDDLSGSERVICLDEETGEKLWVFSYDRPYQFSFPGGPRCTPSVADGKVYVLGAEGDLHCLDAVTGALVWKKSFSADFGAATPQWGHSAHPFVHGDMVYCIVGGRGSVAVAFDKNTGEERWRALSASEPGYCGPSIVRRGGADQLIIWHPEALSGLNPESGDVHWSADLKPSYGLAVTVPRVSGSRMYVSGQGGAGALFEFNSTKPDVEMLWRANRRNAVFTCNNTPVFTEDAIYGVDIETSALTAVDPDDGTRLWETTAPVLAADSGRVRHGAVFKVRVRDTDMFFIFNEVGDFIIAELTPRAYREIGRAHVLEPTNNAFGRPVVWSHPAFAGQTMFARNDARIVAVNLNRQSYPD